MILILKILNGLMSALFLFAAALQYNDPDPLRWAAMYVAAAVVCLLATRARAAWWPPCIVGAIALGWACIYASRGAWTVPFFEMFAEWEMKNQSVVETREMFGLLIIAAWMLILTIVARRQRAR